MAHALRDRTTPKALAQGRQVIDFKGRLADFERLSQIVERDLDALDAADRPKNWRNAPLEARLEFGFSDVSETLPSVSGNASATVSAVCQRCLEATELRLAVALNHLLLSGMHSDIDGFEVWELDDQAFRPSELVEEALIMALPISAVHENPEDCGPLAGQVDPGTTTKTEATRPFADLRALMKTKE